MCPIHLSKIGSMKTIEQLEFKLEIEKSGAGDIKAPALMVEAKWWFDQIKKAVESVPDLPQQIYVARNRRSTSSRYKII